MNDKATPRVDNGPCLNTDRELWRERECDYYADSIHVTEGGGIGMNCGGYVIVQPIRKWHESVRELAQSLAREGELRRALQMLYDENMEYIRLNNLCGAENNLVMKIARAALKTSTCGNCGADLSNHPTSHKCTGAA